MNRRNRRVLLVVLTIAFTVFQLNATRLVFSAIAEPKKPTTPARLYPVIEARVIDGDSIETLIDLGFDVSYRSSARIVGVDTPEKNTDAGKAVKRVVEKWVAAAGNQLWVRSVGYDKFGGRYDAIAIDLHDNATLNDYLLKNGLGKPFDGSKAKQPWTADELAAILSKANAIAGN